MLTNDPPALSECLHRGISCSGLCSSTGRGSSGHHLAKLSVRAGLWPQTFTFSGSEEVEASQHRETAPCSVLFPWLSLLSRAGRWRAARWVCHCRRGLVRGWKHCVRVHPFQWLPSSEALLSQTIVFVL